MTSISIYTTPDSGRVDRVEQASVPGEADVEYFNDLYRDQLSDHIASSLGDASNEYHSMDREYKASLDKAVSSNNPADVVDSMRTMSDYIIRTSMLAKTAGQTKQAIDKLTNLQ